MIDKSYAVCEDTPLLGKLATPWVIVETVVGYVHQIVLATVDKGAETIAVRADPTARFAASVSERAGTYEIVASAGLADTLSRALNLLPEGPFQSLQRLSLQLFDEPPQGDVIKGSLINGALIFILLHEYGHIAAGHFKLLAEQGGADAELAFDEVMSDFSFQGERDDLTSRLIELEADNLAFNLLLDLSYPIFTASADVQALLKGRDLPNWQDQLIPPVVELMFYSAALALALVDAHRKRSRCSGDHPRPLARMLNLAGLMVRRMTQGAWISEGTQHRLAVDDSIHAQLRTFFIPALVNGVELCEAALANPGLDLSSRPSFSDPDHFAWAVLVNDYINLIKGAPKPFLTEDGRELHSLSQAIAAFDTSMRPYRVRNWWN
jgi:hypothetical protein